MTIGTNCAVAPTNVIRTQARREETSAVDHHHPSPRAHHRLLLRSLFTGLDTASARDGYLFRAVLSPSVEEIGLGIDDVEMPLVDHAGDVDDGESQLRRKDLGGVIGRVQREARVPALHHLEQRFPQRGTNLLERSEGRLPRSLPYDRPGDAMEAAAVSHRDY